MRGLMRIPFSFWFLTCLFVSSLLYSLIYRLVSHNYIVITLILCTLALLVPFGGFDFITFFIPLFGMGIILSKTQLLNTYGLWKVVLAGTAVASFYVILWQPYFYIYVTPSLKLMHNPTVHSAYAFIGRNVFGVLFFVFCILAYNQFFRKLDKLPSWIDETSRNSLAIYTLHLGTLQVMKFDYRLSPSLINDFLLLALSVIIVFLLNRLIRIIRLSRYASLFILGETDRK